MKIRIIAVAISVSSFLTSFGVANAAEVYNKDGNKLDVYGKVSGLRYFSDDSGEDGDKTYARLGFKGETQINSLLAGYGQWEYNFQGNNSEGKDAQENNKTRLAFAGLKAGDYGSFDYGRNYGLVYDALSYTDVAPEFGGDTVFTDNYFIGRVGGVATYRNSDFFGQVDGLNFAVQYLSENDRSSARQSNGDGWATSASYEYEGFGIVGAYGAADRTAKQEVERYGRGDTAEQWATGLKYDANNLYLAANYGETRNATPINHGFANKAQAVVLVAQYQFDFGLRPSISYVKNKAKDVEGIGDEIITNYVEVGATYFFNKNMSTFVDYKINQIDDDNKLNVSSDDVVAAGVTYQF